MTRPTDQRIRDYKDGREDPALAMVYYQFGLTVVTIPGTEDAMCKVRYSNTTIDLILKTDQTVRLDAALKQQPGE